VIYRVESPLKEVVVPKEGRRPDWYGNLYEESLQRVGVVENERVSAAKWDIRSLGRRETKNGIDGYHVTWTTGEKTWEPRSMLLQDVPKLVGRRER